MLRLTPTASLLQKLVQIPSVNPADNPGVTDPGELACAEFICSYLHTIGAKSFLQKVKPQRPNVLGVFPSISRPKLRLLIAPHTDTVSVSGMSIQPFCGKISQGKLWGRGASDTKGPMAAMLVALKEWHEAHQGRLPTIRVTFAGLMGEEAGNMGAITLAQTQRKKKTFDFAIIGEPTDLKIVHAHNGVLWLKVSTLGKARHASIANAADNAILRINPAITYFEKLQKQASKVTHLGIRSVCVSTIQGGTKTNISPALCELRIDIRTDPQAKLDRVFQIIKKELKQAAPHAMLELSSRCDPLNTDRSHPFIQTILPVTKGLAQAPWFCDAAFFAAVGIPSIAFGPGSITQAHTKDEWIDLQALEEGKNRFLAMLHLLEVS
ncbi:MAG: M20/M25/M40 family metallo-hydrolase [Blastochloris sp.]|nr:M20/M25/M40 family metallo-hydrolase [Blastochloris sp.]